MKRHAIKFDEFLFNYDKEKLHKKLDKILQSKSKCINDLCHTIIYGPPGIGKYTTSVAMIRKYSESNLLYEKKTCIECNGVEHYIKISDIHYEVDFELLGCNAKVLWSRIHQHILDIVQTKPENIGIILCKNFHAIHGELLDTFYSYMQTKMHDIINIKYIFLTESASFIPERVANRCHMIHMSRPARTTYNKCLSIKLPKTVTLMEIGNIKTLPDKQIISHKKVCDKIIERIMNQDTISVIRDNLYNILIYNLDIHECIWYIFAEMCNKKNFSDDEMFHLLIETYKFFVYFNNNYRPIYHLENYAIYIIKIIHGYGGSM